MRKLLLMVGLMASGTVLTQAQNQINIVKLNRERSFSKIDLSAKSAITSAKPINKNKSGRAQAGINKRAIASSFNLLGVLVSESNPLNADQNLNSVVFFHRQDNGGAGGAGASGYMQATISTDKGVNFSTTHMLANSDVHLCRYPTGGIVNTTGNTSFSNAYPVVSGPYHPGALWHGNFFCSEKGDGTNNQQVYLTNGDPGVKFQNMARYFSQGTDDGKYHVLGIDYDINRTTAGSQAFNGTYVNTGTVNTTTNQFTYTQTKIRHPFVYNSTDSSHAAFTTPGMAWSQDGTVGYVFFIGRDSLNDFKSYQPIVYKTTDSGANWNLMALYDFSNLAEITQYLSVIKGTTNGKRPFFTQSRGFDATVDSLKNLHIAIAISSSSSNHVDSLDYTYNGPIQMFDVYTTATGWKAMLIDTARAGVSTGTPWATQQIDNRLQISRSQTGGKIFYGWMDRAYADMQTATDSLDQADIFIKGFDMATGKVTPVVSVTRNTAEAGNNFWMYMSNITFVDAQGICHIPMTTTDSDAGRDDGTGAVTHYYMDGVQLEPYHFGGTAGINNLSATKFELGQNVPNPFHTSTTISLNVEKTSNVVLTVSNSFGQKVMEQKASNAYGKVNFTVEKGNLSEGIYFYTITIGDKSVTKKMVIN